MYTVKNELWRKISYSHINRSLRDLFLRFSAYELYLVGGCVRDMLLGKEPKDYDLCTNLKPEEVKDLLKDVPFECNEDTAISYHLRGERVPDTRYHFIDTGLKHGTITVHDTLYDMFYEITTYRVDGKYSDGRHPDEVVFTPSLEEDLKRRDFTINSFAYNYLTNELKMLDASYLDDLKYGIIRTVGKAEERFKEDALRMLRAFRFAAKLGFVIDKDTYQSITEYPSLISKISKERIRDELTKILLSDNPRYLELIISSGLEEYMFGINDDYPEMPPRDYRKGITPMTDMLMCEHENPWHYTDVFHHTLDVIERVPKTFELRWAALFHDMGKPATKKPRPKGPAGHYVYYDHPEKSAEIAANLMDILKFSNEQKEVIIKFVKYHDVELSGSNMSTFKRYLADIGVDAFPDFIKLRIADASAHQIYKDTYYAVDSISTAYNRYIKIIKNKEPLYLKDLAVNGDDIKALGAKGKRIGKTLEYLLKKVYGHPSYNNKKQLLAIAKRFLETSVDK